MTVSYTGGLLRQLVRWKGSVYKALWPQMVIYLMLYYALQCLYLFKLDDLGRRRFEKLTIQFTIFLRKIKLEFLLGFFISQIVARWWQQFNTIAWPENIMLHLNAHLPGEEYKHIRQTISRWTNLTSVLVWRRRSTKVGKRFPTDDHLVQSGLMTEEEKSLYEAVQTSFDKWWLPTLWITSTLRQCRDAGIIHPAVFRIILRDLRSWNTQFQRMLHYDWVSFPLVYTQVVTIATYGYFALTLIGRQLITYSDNNEYNSRHYVPFVTLLQMIFYMGWLKVGEALMDPFGEDEEDFELHWVLDRNLYVAYMMVTTVADQLPSVTPSRLSHLPYTKAAAACADPGYFDKDHMAGLGLEAKDVVWSAEEGTDAAAESVKKRRGSKVTPSKTV